MEKKSKIEKLVEIIKITSNSRRSVNDFNSDAFLWNGIVGLSHSGGLFYIHGA